MRRIGLSSGGVWLLLVGMAHAAPPPVDYNREIQPILSNSCFTCHGPDPNTLEAGLRLDQRESATGAADSGEVAIVPGDSAASHLLARVSSVDVDERMPPAGAGRKPLTAEQIALLKRWIDEGAVYQPHWAFVPPQAMELPKVRDAAWPKNGIDHFVLQRIEQEKLKPSPEASRAQLLRRVTLDLTGLPPTVAELDAFLADPAPDAYEKVVDRLLSSPRYGEQMARHWLDIARYADTNGYQYDTERTMWPWRDWVIEAYNQNMRFDQFTIEQLAGDLLPNATDQQKLATGFNRNHGITIEGGVIDEEYRTEYVIDRVSTTTTAWMGLTYACARCHDHKYDPISQKEFYQFFAFFNQVPERGNSGFTPNLRVASPTQKRRLAQIDVKLKAARAELDAIAPQLAAAQQVWETQAAQENAAWQTPRPAESRSTGGATLTLLDDHSLLVGGANAAHDDLEIVFDTPLDSITAVRLEALTHESLPGGGPGRYGNSNFVLSEFELEISSLRDPQQKRAIRFAAAEAEYSQAGYDIRNAIDGTVGGNNGWAVDGPTRKQPVTALFLPTEPFGYEGGTRLRVRLRHQSIHGQHAIGRPRLSVSDQPHAGISTAARVILAKPAAERSAAEQQALRDHYLAHHADAAARETVARIEALTAEQQKISAEQPTVMIMQDAVQRTTHILNRGQYDLPGEAVEPGTLAALPSFPADAPANRLGLAQWLVDPSHPLTARVAVNRFWQNLFGVGLVKTVEDFGIQGERPSHPELLDWLAREFVTSGWDVKAIQRRIVTSATYRQTSSAPPEAFVKDPENRLLARGPRLRLAAEEIRDTVLAVSGLLVDQVGGPSVYPYQPAGLWMELNNRPGLSREYEVGQGADLYRRSMYTFWKRTVPHPTMDIFDAPSREACTARRSSTNTPLQSLVLRHDPQFVEAARHFAARILQTGGTTFDERLTFAFRAATARTPSAAELAVLRDYFEAQHTEFAEDAEAAQKLLAVGESPVAPLDPLEYATWTAVARLLLNLDETITKN